MTWDTREEIEHTCLHNRDFSGLRCIVMLQRRLKIVVGVFEVKLQRPKTTIQTSRPLEQVCIDFLSLKKSKGEYEHILMITDHYSRYAMAIPIRNQLASTSAKALYEHFFCHHSFPVLLYSEQGRNSDSSVIKELYRLAGVKKSRTTP